MIYCIQANLDYHDDRDGWERFNWVVGYFPDKEDAEKYCKKLGELSKEITIHRGDLAKMVILVEKLYQLDSDILVQVMTGSLQLKFTDTYLLSYDIQEVKELVRID